MRIIYIHVHYNHHYSISLMIAHREKGKKLLHTYLVPVVRPTTEFQKACLLIKRKKFYINFARWFEYSGWLPFYQTVVMYCSFRGQSHFEKAIRARNNIQLRAFYIKPAMITYSLVLLHNFPFFFTLSNLLSLLYEYVQN